IRKHPFRDHTGGASAPRANEPLHLHKRIPAGSCVPAIPAVTVENHLTATTPAPLHCQCPFLICRDGTLENLHPQSEAKPHAPSKPRTLGSPAPLRACAPPALQPSVTPESPAFSPQSR